MQHIVYIESASKLEIESGRLCITSSSEKCVLHSADILAIVVESVHSIVTIPALLLCVRSSIPVILCNEKHQPEIYCINYYRHSELLSIISEQINWKIEKKRSAWIKIIENKIYNQICLLKYIRADENMINAVLDYLYTLKILDITNEEIDTAESISARIYFKGLLGLGFKRFNKDHLNSALNYGYAILRALIMSLITVKGLHPSLGIWHYSTRNRFNLADDLIESLRPYVDYYVVTKNIGSTFNKNDREKILSLLYGTVYFKGIKYNLKQALTLFIDDFKKFMDGRTTTFDTIELRIEEYEER